MAQTLKFGNKTWATKVGSTLAYNDENGNYKPLPFAFTRSSSATRVNKEGLIEVVTNDRPRIDYTDTSDGVLLLENSATNKVIYSQDFTKSDWATSGSIIKEGNTSDILGLDGTQSVGKLTFNGTGSLREDFISIPSGSSSTYTLSFYLKGTVGETLSSYMDTVAGTYVFTSSDILLTGEWQRVSYSINTSSNNVGINIIIRKQSSETVNTVYIWGAMLEQNSVASSYIPTQGSAVTRVAETANGAGNSEVFNDSEGVLFADIAALEETNSFEAISINDNSTSDRIFMGYYSDDLYVTVLDGSQAKYDVNTPINVKQNNKIAVKYKAQDFSFYLNGFEIDASVGINGGTTPSGLSQLSFNRGDGVEPFYGKTKEIGYYDAILTDLELETLTSYRSWESMVNELNLNIIYNG